MGNKKNFMLSRTSFKIGGAAVLVLLLFLILSSCSSGGKADNPKQNGIGKENSNQEWTVNSIMDDRELTTKSGYTQVMLAYREEKPTIERPFIIPNLEAWSNEFFADRGEDVDGSKYTYYYKFAKGQYANANDLLMKYFDVLKGQYAAALVDESSGSGFNGSWHVWAFDLGSGYSGGRVEEFSIKGNICVYTDCEQYLTFSYTNALGFADTGLREDGSIIDPDAEFSPLEYRRNSVFELTENGKYKYKASGIDSQSKGSITFLFTEESQYEKGDIFTLADYQKEAPNQSAGYYIIEVDSNEYISAALGVSTKGSDIEYFEDIYVKVIEKTESVTVLHFYIRIKYGSIISEYEGLLAAKTAQSGGSSASSSNKDGYVSFSECDKCFMGEIDCTWCRTGNGKADCSGCVNGKVYNGISGKYENCPTCHGSGKVTCTRCRGSGKIDCPDCY